MKLLKAFALVITLTVCCNQQSFARGKTGHSIVAQIAMNLVYDSTRAKVLHFLNDISIDGAGNWMDSMRSNPDYDFMRPWHYLDFDKEESYSRPLTDDNLISRLSICYNEIKHYKLLSEEQVRFDLLCLFHLMGDLHQPLHAGYSDDKGGNARVAYYLKSVSNLHKVWDEQIIDSNQISMDSCMPWLGGLSAETLQKIKTIDFISWYNESRSMLKGIYNFSEVYLDQQYIDKNKKVIEQRLLFAGIRLAAMLDTLFPPEKPKRLAIPTPLPNSITADSAVNYTGKKVTVCTKVFSIKSLDNVSFIDVGGAFPNSPLTIVIFKKDRENFTPSIEELYKDQYICVRGIVKMFNGKPEIVVSSPVDIIVQ